MKASRRVVDNIAYDLNQEHRPSKEFCGTKWAQVQKSGAWRAEQIQRCETVARQQVLDATDSAKRVKAAYRLREFQTEAFVEKAMMKTAESKFRTYCRGHIDFEQ
eukprot:TRINITY_DN623_c0_g1_i2.p1 TRINITY_DN623_c0_g1~~TRINITY_DN623_c0_g1_i2.p1  ORF type:complete len:105 (-),score=6.53 TRINITY_DN623_c0_g1_i2:16-330(-)